MEFVEDFKIEGDFSNYRNRHITVKKDEDKETIITIISNRYDGSVEFDISPKINVPITVEAALVKPVRWSRCL